MLEPYDGKLSRTVLRRESGSNPADLVDYGELTKNLGGTFIDMMSGRYIINVLEPKLWATDDDIEEEEDETIPLAFKQSTLLSQHVSFLKDFFKTYKEFDDEQIDTLEIMLMSLYEKFGINEEIDITLLGHTEFPVLQDLYEYVDNEFKNFKEDRNKIYKRETLRKILLSLRSICIGTDSKFFNGYTNITENQCITFGVKALLQANKSLRNALLFNILSFMSNELLTKGFTIASVDELYLFLTNLVAVEYIRNFIKRVRKKESAVILASQNLEDFNIEGIRELTKPLFAIPVHVFLFNAGNTDAKFYIDSLRLEESEYELIKYPQQGVCLYKCGNERYNLAVHAPEYKEKLFGKQGGR